MTKKSKIKKNYIRKNNNKIEKQREFNINKLHPDVWRACLEVGGVPALSLKNEEVRPYFNLMQYLEKPLDKKLK